MARIHGRFGRIYLGATEGGAATPVAGTTRWTLESQTDFTPATAQGDTSTVFLAGLPGGQFSFSSIYDDSEYTGAIFTAASEGTPRKIYLYPKATDTTKYWFGTAYVSASVESPVDGVTTLSGQGAAATGLIAVGIT